MPISRLSVIKSWFLPLQEPKKNPNASKKVSRRYPLLIGLRSCPYSEALRSELRQKTFSSNLPLREFWVASREDPMFVEMKKRFHHSTYPILVAVKDLPPLHDPPTRSSTKGSDIKIGGYSEFIDLCKKI